MTSYVYLMATCLAGYLACRLAANINSDDRGDGLVAWWEAYLQSYVAYQLANCLS